MENFPITNIVEQAVGNQVNSLVGTKDTNLNTIVKMTLMNEIKPLQDNVVNDIINNIKSNNEVEKYFIEMEYGLTYDLSGNSIPVNNVYAKEEG
jgi:hypothetical protein